MKNYKTPRLLVPVHLVGACHAHPPLSQPRHKKMTVSPCSRQADTSADAHASMRARSGHSRISATMQGLRLVHRQTSQASHQMTLPPGWGRAGERPPSILQAMGAWGAQLARRGDPLSSEPSTVSFPMLSRNQTLCPGERSFPLRRSPSGADPSSQQAP